MSKGKNKMKKKVFTLLAVLSIYATTVTGVYAATAYFSTSVPTMQGYKEIGSRNKDRTTSIGSVSLTKKDPDSVSFSVKCKDGSFGRATQVAKTNQTYTVYYNNSYNAGTTMTARFRNANWSLNSNMITGTFDYK